MVKIELSVFCTLTFLLAKSIVAQVVDISSYSINPLGIVEIEVNSTPTHYYCLQVEDAENPNLFQTTSIALGGAESVTLSESLGALPLSRYRVLEYDIANPNDTDGDGLNDIAEMAENSGESPLNAAPSIDIEHGSVEMKSEEDFNILATNQNTTPWAYYLTGVTFTKFIILDFDTDEPKLYFINCNQYPLHADFAAYLGVNHTAPSVKKGQIFYSPHIVSSGGKLGTYLFNFSSTLVEEFQTVQRVHELLAANMPFLENSLSYYVLSHEEEEFEDSLLEFQNSRVPVLFESDAFAGVNYIGLHQAEGYGYLRWMSPSELPNERDIVVYEALPNVLPHVGGIISSVMQTPLSHVNLRAIQENVPNAFIRNPLENDSILALLGHYVYFKTNQSNFELREATLEEVNEWYSSKRPTQVQVPPLNLSYRQILPLNEISFGMFDGFGAKTANVAEMRTFGFSEGTVPDGFGIPFYYYKEFMEYNHFFENVQQMISDSEFLTNRAYRESALSQLRTLIKNAPMPSWMIDSLSQMHAQFENGVSVRCRSSTNNEDLPEYSGAGLYDSKTHHPDEGHISKTIRQVYASLWNLRAFDEREFNRVDHFSSAMGVLCHPNYDSEVVNGVGVTSDPVYSTDDNFYLNSQLGEELITNPNTTRPEELLIKKIPSTEEDLVIIQYSSLLDTDSLLMNSLQLDSLRQYMKVIHDRFEILYNAVGNESFAMDVEFKITANNKLAIKQARPWVSYKASPIEMKNDLDCDYSLAPNPCHDVLYLRCRDCQDVEISVFNGLGQLCLLPDSFVLDTSTFMFNVGGLPDGVYIIQGLPNGGSCGLKFIKQ
jgi:hypothetical protein